MNLKYKCAKNMQPSNNGCLYYVQPNESEYLASLKQFLNIEYVLNLY